MTVRNVITEAARIEDAGWHYHINPTNYAAIPERMSWPISWTHSKAKLLYPGAAEICDGCNNTSAQSRLDEGTWCHYSIPMQINDSYRDPYQK